MLPVRRFLLALLAVPVVAATGSGAEPYNPFPPYVLKPGYYAGLLDQGAARLKKVEAVEMASSILGGGDMGPNSTWFHPAQSRYDWKWLAGRYDKNRDGQITEDEFPSEEKSPELRKLFERLDRDRDGRITAADFDWSERSPYVREMMMAGGWLRALGGDNGGKITREGWEKTFDRLSNGKGFITPEDLHDRMIPPPRRPQGGPSGEPNPMMLLKGLFDGDIGSPFEGPAVGARAPDFRLKMFDGKGEIALSDLRGKPVVIVFGSFTGGPYRSQFGTLEAAYKRYAGRAHFLAVYVREAHPLEGWRMSSNDAAGVKVAQPKTAKERTAVARTCCDTLGITMPMVVDGMDDRVGHLYSGMPDRLYVLDGAGRVAYKGGRGPFGFKVGEMEQSLVMLLLDADKAAAKAER